jgi:hypothetical protein
LLKLLRHRRDLLELIVHHLDVFREIDDVVCLVISDLCRIDNDDLRRKKRRSEKRNRKSDKILC